jgi:hypothetical protein
MYEKQHNKIHQKLKKQGEKGECLRKSNTDGVI